MARFGGLRGRKLSFVISSVCGLCFFVFGYSQGDFGGLLTVPSFLRQFPQVDTVNNKSAHNARIQGITVATWNIGCFASALIAIFSGDALGRRKTLLLGLVIWMIGEIIQASSYSYGQLVIGRFIAGFGNGFNTATAPAYQAECVKSHRKGTILMVTAGAFIAAGLAFSYWITFAFAYIQHSSVAWRFPIAFQIIFALVAFVLLLWLPESPRWLILTGRETEALTVLGALNDLPEDGEDVRDEFLQIKDAILEMSMASSKSLASNSESRHLHRAALAYFIQIFQQMTGINLALQYLALMFWQQTGYTLWLARLMAGCASTEYFLASFVAVVGIDRFWGRRSLMIFGATGMSLCMILLTVLIYLKDKHQVHGTNIAATVFIFGFATFFAIGWQGMAWLYQVEVVPLRIRGPANALSTSANWMINTVVVLITPIAFNSIGWKTYIIFAVTNAAIVPLIYYFYPETAYRSLEEVDVLFDQASNTKNPWLSVVKIARFEPLWFGRGGDKPFDYSQSEWHQRHLRFSSSGSTLRDGTEKTETHSDSPNSTPPSFDKPSDGERNSDSDPTSSAGTDSNRGLITRKKKNNNFVPPDSGFASSPSPDSSSLPSPPLAHSRSRDLSTARTLGTTHTRNPSSSRDFESVMDRREDLAPPHLHVNSTQSAGAQSGRPSSELAPGPGIIRSDSGRETYLSDGLRDSVGRREWDEIANNMGAGGFGAHAAGLGDNTATTGGRQRRYIDGDVSRSRPTSSGSGRGRSQSFRDAQRPRPVSSSSRGSREARDAGRAY